MRVQSGGRNVGKRKRRSRRKEKEKKYTSSLCVCVCVCYMIEQGFELEACTLVFDLFLLRRNVFGVRRNRIRTQLLYCLSVRLLFYGCCRRGSFESRECNKRYCTSNRFTLRRSRQLVVSMSKTVEVQKSIESYRFCSANARINAIATPFSRARCLYALSACQHKEISGV